MRCLIEVVLRGMVYGYEESRMGCGSTVMKLCRYMGEVVAWAKVLLCFVVCVLALNCAVIGTATSTVVLRKEVVFAANGRYDALMESSCLFRPHSLDQMILPLVL